MSLTPFHCVSSYSDLFLLFIHVVKISLFESSIAGVNECARSVSL